MDTYYVVSLLKTNKQTKQGDKIAQWLPEFSAPAEDPG